MHQHYHTVIAQQQVAAKRNEIGAAKTLFTSMSLVGMVITADALLTQKGITSVIEQRGGAICWLSKGITDKLKNSSPRSSARTSPQAGSSEHHTSEVRKG